MPNWLMTVIRVFVIVVLLVGAEEGWSQAGAGRKAMRALEKEKWEKCRAILEKALHKDSTASNIYYGFSRFYFTPSNPDFGIDTAYSYINQALDASRAGAWNNRGKHAPDTTTFLYFRGKIDSAAFARARQEHSETSYNFFIKRFVHAVQLDTARLLRDEVAWQDALLEDSPEAYARYLENYPSSLYAGKASTRHEELIFRINTRDKRLGSFESYLAEYPQSPYRHLVEEQILEIYTADGSADKFIAFLQRYPQGTASHKARDILYHIKRETEPRMESFSFWTDSLRRTQQLNANFLVPFIADKKFGFMDASGKEIIAATGISLYDDYRCGNILDDILVHGDGVIARDGTRIYNGEVSELSDLGYGFIGIETRNCYRVMHKTGFTLGSGCAEDAVVMDGRFVALLEAGHWALYAFTGRLLTSGWEEVKSMGEVIALRKDGKWSLVTARQVGAVADQQPLKANYIVDDVRSWSQDLVWAKRGNTEGVLDGDLQVRVPFGEQLLRREVFGVISRSPDCLRLFTPGFVSSSCVEDVNFNSNWVCVKRNDKWSLYNFVKGADKAAYDSIAFTGIFAAGYRNDSVRVFFNDSIYLDFKDGDLAFISRGKARAFLQVEWGRKKTVYNDSGQKLFDGNYDEIQHAGGDYFIVGRNGKKGLITSDGKQVLPFGYDAIGEIEGTRVPLLRGIHFGLYDTAAKKEIRPAYDKNLQPYNEELLVAFRHGKSGMIDLQNRTRMPFQYEAIRFWNDTSALALQDNVWKLIEIATNKPIIGDIHDYSIVNDSDNESVLIIRRGREFGVLSSTRGEVIPVSYTDLVNIGSARDPMYFTEKHVREASLSVVIYYDASGKPVRHQALESDDFDAIYCEEN